MFRDLKTGTLFWGCVILNCILSLLGCLILFHASCALFMFLSLSKMGLLRVKPSAELAGLDVLKHNEPAYGFGNPLDVNHI